MMGRLGQKLAPVIGFSIAMLAAATLTSYVVIAQRGTATYERSPRVERLGPVIAQRPDTIPPLILTAPAAQQGPVQKPQPVVTGTVEPDPIIAAPPVAETGTSGSQDQTPETFTGSLIADSDGSLTDRAFGVLESTTIRAGLIRPSQDNDPKDPVKGPDEPPSEGPGEARDPEDDDLTDDDHDDGDDDDDDSTASRDESHRKGNKGVGKQDDDSHPSHAVSGDSSDDSHTGSFEGKEMGGKSSKGHSAGSAKGQGSKKSGEDKHHSHSHDGGSHDGGSHDSGSHD